MRLTRSCVPFVLIAAVATTPGLIALALAGSADAQGSGMNCYAMAGGRASCTLSTNALLDRVSADVADRNADIAARQRRLVKKVAEFVRDGHCADALELALKATDPMVAANTARLCGVPDPDAAPRPQAPRP
ncbi:MAG TPA: hypothetical protein VF495_00640 [Phenylobacterium sp.]|jgi:hypothetical protein